MKFSKLFLRLPQCGIQAHDTEEGTASAINRFIRIWQTVCNPDIGCVNWRLCCGPIYVYHLVFWIPFAFKLPFYVMVYCHVPLKDAAPVLGFVNTLRPRQNCRHFADDIFKCIFIDEMYEFSFRFDWNVFLRFQLTKFQISSDNGLVTSHYMNQCWLVYWRIYASLGLNQLMLLTPLKWTFYLNKVLYTSMK